MTTPIKILFVDDDKGIISSLERLFRISGYEVHCACSGEAGLEIMKDHSPFHVVVSDYRMPGMNGVDFLRRVAELRPDTVRIILTAHEETKILLSSINEGNVYKFVLKPWDDDEFGMTIANAVERYELVLQSRRLSESLTVSNGELRRLNERLEDIVLERTAELQKFATAIENATDWVLVTNREGVITYANQAVSDISGYDSGYIVGKKPDIWKSGKHDEAFYRELWDSILSGRPFRHIFINRKENGDFFLLDNTIAPVRDEQGAITSFVSTGKDLTQQKYLEDRIAYLAYYDPVTDLPNKSLFCDRVEMSLSRSRHHGRLVAVAVAGIDNFGLIIDAVGPQGADKILVEISSRLKAFVREGDTVARLGTNDFGLVLNDIARKDDILPLVDNIRRSIATPVTVGSGEFRVTGSMGISIFPDDAQDVQELMRNAYLSLTDTRKSGGNGLQFYMPEMNRRASEFVDMGKRLVKAISDRDFVLHYQPYFDAETGTIKGVESLLRLKTSDHEIIMPDRFIYVLEETGLILEAGQWVVEEVLRQIRQWLDEGHKVVPVTVNLSAVQFRQKDLVSNIMAAVSGSGIDPRCLSFELTESTLMHDVDSAVSAVNSLKGYGASILIDDFGTAYSSLNYLARFNADYLKIDISFVRGVTSKKTDEAIVKAIVSLAHSMGMETIAEGIETEEQLRALRVLGCDMVQGFFFGRPMPPEQFAGKFLEKG